MRKLSLLSGQASDIRGVVEETADVLEKGGVALIPTETVYGLVCRWDNGAAKEKIFRMKNRPRDKHFQMLAVSLAQAEEWGYKPDEAARKIAAVFFPGALTLIAPSSFGGHIGLRVPDHNFTMALLQKTLFPLAGTSANLSGEAISSDSADAVSSLLEQPDIVVDAGRIAGVPSTVAKIANGLVEIIREGAITKKMIFETLFAQRQ
jgi:L-threonylcarbamoyladenylate synthase